MQISKYHIYIFQAILLMFLAYEAMRFIPFNSSAKAKVLTVYNKKNCGDRITKFMPHLRVDKNCAKIEFRSNDGVLITTELPSSPIGKGGILPTLKEGQIQIVRYKSSNPNVAEFSFRLKQIKPWLFLK